MHLKSIYEELACLYLRLNGFLQHINYVLETTSGIAKEVDIIAYRPANAIEVDDKGNKLEPDHSLFNKIVEKLKGTIEKPLNTDELMKNYSIAAIVSVKGLHDEPWSEDEEKLKGKVDYALNILGLSGKVKSCDLIENGIHIVDSNKTIILLLGFSGREDSKNGKNTISWRKSNACYLHITHEATLVFILERIRQCKLEKMKSIQYYPIPIFTTLILLSKLNYEIRKKDNTLEDNLSAGS